MNIIQKSIFVVAISAITGCSGCSSFPQVPSDETVNARIEGYQLPQTPKEGKALVYVIRPSIVIGLVRFGVYVDGKEAESRIGHNRTRQYIHFDLEPGEHTIYSRASNWSEIKVTAKAGETIFIEQEHHAFVTNKLLRLADDAGIYRVKNAKFGTISKPDP